MTTRAKLLLFRNLPNSMSLRLASPQKILSWSSGEVKNGKTYRYDELDWIEEYEGLFCQSIFGSEEDYLEPYRSERCTKMGHILLAEPVAHILFVHTGKSPASLLLGKPWQLLRKVVYFTHYLVLSQGDTPLRPLDMLSSSEYRKARKKYGGRFQAQTGAAAIQKALASLDLKGILEKLRQNYPYAGSRQARLTARMEMIQGLLDSGILPEWMILDVIPVIPPVWRPVRMNDDGEIDPGPLNHFYAKIVQRNQILREAMEEKEEAVIILQKKRMLQAAVDMLFNNEQCLFPLRDKEGKPLPSLSDRVNRRISRFRHQRSKKIPNNNGGPQLVVNPELKMDQCAIPKEMALEAFSSVILHDLAKRDPTLSKKGIQKKWETRSEEVWKILDKIMQESPVLLLQTRHLLPWSRMRAFYIVLTDRSTIELSPLSLMQISDFYDESDKTVKVHVPLSQKAQKEAKERMVGHRLISPTKEEDDDPPLQPCNLLRRTILIPKEDDLPLSPEAMLGCYYLTKANAEATEIVQPFSGVEEVSLAHYHRRLQYPTPIWFPVPKDREVFGESFQEEMRDRTIYTTAGRVLFNDVLPPGMPFYNCVIDKEVMKKIIIFCHTLPEKRAVVELLQSIENLGERVTGEYGTSLSMADWHTPNQSRIVKNAIEEAKQIEEQYHQGYICENECKTSHSRIRYATRKKIYDEFMRYQEEEYSRINQLASIVKSKICSIEELFYVSSFDVWRIPKSIWKWYHHILWQIYGHWWEGLSVLDYFYNCKAIRGAITVKVLISLNTQHWIRKLMDVLHPVRLNIPDCHTISGVIKEEMCVCDEECPEYMQISIQDIVDGYTSRDMIYDEYLGEIIVSENDIITSETVKKILAVGHKKICVRNPLTCESKGGVCVRCYGACPSTDKPAEEGMAVGILAAHSLGFEISGYTVTSNLFELHLWKKKPIRSKKKMDILRLLHVDGPDKAQERLLQNILPYLPKSAYKDVDLVLRQMFRTVKVAKSGDTKLVPGSLVDRWESIRINDAIRPIEGKECAKFENMVFGISKAAYLLNSFLYAASIDHNPLRVLLKAALAGRKSKMREFLIKMFLNDKEMMESE